MIRGLLRLGVLGAIGATVADRLLARRTPDGPAPIESMVVIDEPIERVWAVLSDVPRQPEWMDDLVGVELVTPPPIGEGSRAIGTVRILGVTVRDPVTITAFEPPTRFAIRHEGLFTGTGELTLEPNVDGTGTVVRWSERLVAPALPHVADAVGRPVFATVFQRDLENLRALVEAEAVAAPPADDPAVPGRGAS